MTITQLRYVLAVAESNNFTKAAELSFVTQPTLSMQIQKLEEELGVQIFDRMKKPVELTEVGRMIVKQAQRIINESERIHDIVEQQKGFVGGELKIGIIPTVMPTILPLFLKTFIGKYPDLNLVVEEVNTEILMEEIENGQIDVGIAATPLKAKDIMERVLYYEPFQAYIPENNPLFKKKKIAEEDLHVDDILLLKDGHCFRDSVINICKAGDSPEARGFNLKSGSFETILRLCDEGLGMTLLPYLHSQQLEAYRQKNIRPFVTPVPAREVSLIYAKSQLKIHIIDALYDTISSLVKGAIKYHDVKIISPFVKS